jgi:hypothetical protein
MPEIIDLDELVPDDITFKYKGNEWTIPGDLKTGQTLELYSLLTKLARTEATGGAGELQRIIGRCETALLPIFQVHHPDLAELPFGAAGLAHVMRTVLSLIGLLQEVTPEPPPAPAKTPAKKTASTSTRTKPGSAGRPKKTAGRSAGSSRSSSS